MSTGRRVIHRPQGAGTHVQQVDNLHSSFWSQISDNALAILLTLLGLNRKASVLKVR